MNIRVINIKGFTLPEMLVVSLIVAIVIVVLISALIITNLIFQFADISAKLQSDARLVVRRVSQDVRQSTPNWVTITQNSPVAGTDTIVYRIPRDSDNDGTPDMTASGEPNWANGITITISVDTDNNKLIRDDGTTQTTIADNANRINFVDHGIDPALYLDELDVTIELEKSDIRGNAHTMASTAIIDMRN